MSNPSSKAAVLYEPETAWGEAISTFALFRLPVTKAVDVSGLTHAKIDASRVVQRMGDGTQYILGPQGGSVKTTMWLTGHGSNTSGATTATATETLLGKVFGNVGVSAAAGTTFTGGTATVPTTTASGTFAAGSLCRAGVQGDTKGNGQFLAIGTHATTTLNLLTGLDLPPTTDVLYSAVNIYPSEDPINGTTVQPIRLLFQTANLQYECHGCFPTSAKITGLNTGEIPVIEITWGVSWWAYNTTTFPSVVATETFQPAANAGGSLFVAPVGTATRAKRTYRGFTLDFNINVTPLVGPGGLGNSFQTIVGARRTGHTCKVTWTEDADIATLTPALPALGVGTVDYHLLWTGNPTAGKSMGIYCPTIRFSNVPLQKADGNINRLAIEAMAQTGPTVTSDLTASSIRIGFA